MQLKVVTSAPFNASTPLPALREDLTPPRLHYVRDHFRRPEAREDWSVAVGGLGVSASLHVADLRRLPQRDVVVTLECAGNSRTRFSPVPPGTPWDDGAVSTATWRGVALRDALARVPVPPSAVEVLFRGADAGAAAGRELAYERSLPLGVALHPDTMLVTGKDGGPLPLLHGGPVRVLVPRWYGMASVKWLAGVVFLDRPFDGFYQREHYTLADGSPVTRMRPKALVLAPAAGDAVALGARSRIEGRAWAGAGVARVEVSTDGAATWREAELGPSLGPFAWRAFHADWTPTERGPHVLAARATDAEGTVQPLSADWNPHGYGNNSVVPIGVGVV